MPVIFSDIKLPIERLFDWFVCDPIGGTLLWRERLDVPKEWNSRRAGRYAGTLSKRDGYVIVQVHSHRWTSRAHRIVWAMTKGAWPKGQLDHKNGIRNDNRLRNLREATQSNQTINSETRSDNSLGIRGVRLHKPSGRFQARIGISGRVYHLGLFLTSEEAAGAYRDAAKRLHGDFVRRLPSP
jgi:hypothetical protein